MRPFFSNLSSRATRGICTSVVTGLVALVALTACRESSTPPVISGQSAADSADQMLIGVTFLMTTKGIERGDLNADTAYVLDEQTRFDLRRAHVNFKTETGAPEGTMDANKGVYNQRTQILEGWGDVVVKLTDGRTLKSPHVTFNQLTHKVSSDTAFTLTRANGDQYNGKGFLSNQAFTTFQCLANCKGDGTILLPATVR